jgi:hypothetical protein
MTEPRPSRVVDMEEFQRLLKEYLVEKDTGAKERLVTHTRSLKERRSPVAIQCAVALCHMLYEHGDPDAIYIATLITDPARALKLRATLHRRNLKGRAITPRQRTKEQPPPSPLELRKIPARPEKEVPLPTQYERHKDLIKRKSRNFYTRLRNLMKTKS